MLGFQEIFQNTLEKSLRPGVLLTLGLEKRLKSIGINITDEQKANFENQFEKMEGDTGTLHINLSDEQIHSAGADSEEELKPKIQEIVDGLMESVKKLAETPDDFMKDMVDSVSNKMVKYVRNLLHDRMEDMAEDQQAIYLNFAEQVELAWGNALKLLQGYIVMFDEVAQGYLGKLAESGNSDLTLDVLIRIKAKSSQTAKEILVLLRNGFADGAKARWRYLHELSVVAYFIAEHGDKTAEMYLDHEAIERYKAAIQYNELHDRLGYSIIPSEEIEELRRDFEYLIGKYGENYKEEYGWAADALGMARPRFRDIEKSVKLDAIRPHYKSASYNIHACSSGVLYRLGLGPEEDGVLLAGPSGRGLSNPGRLAVISLNQIAAAMLTRNPDMDSIVIGKVMLNYGKEVEDEFLRIENELTAFNEAQE
jgi:DNA-binding ferritin-like protein